MTSKMGEGNDMSASGRRSINRAAHGGRVQAASASAAWLVAVAAAAAVGAEDTWPLVKDGETKSVILIADDANRLITVAAEELQYHVREASGAELPIVKEGEFKGPLRHVVLIGQSKRAAALGVEVSALPREGFLIHPTQGCLVIAGKDKPIISYRGDGKTVARVNDDPYEVFTQPATLFGVVTWIEEALGVRWVMPGKLGEVIPTRPTIMIRDGEPRIGKPAAIQRQIRFTDASHRKLASDKDYFEPWGVDRETRRRAHLVWARRQRLGKGGYFKITHAFRRWWDDYSKTHPDYFAQQIDGTRNWPSCWPKEAVRLCLSNPAVVDQVMANAREFFAHRRNSTNLDYLAFPVGQNDGNCGWCLCDRCRALDPPEAPLREYPYAKAGQHGAWIQEKVKMPRLTDRFVHFWNAIGKRFEKELPGQMVGIFVYSVTSSPPVREKYGPNLVCAFARNDCLIAPRNRVLDSFRKSTQRFHDAGLRNWYWRPNLMYFDMFGLPLIYAREAGEMVRHAMSHGSVGLDVDSWQGHWATDGINIYVISRLLWNPDRSVDQLIDEYCAAFGRAAPPVKEYFTKLEAFRDRLDPALSDKRVRLDRMAEFYAPELLKELEALLAEARTAAAEDSEAVQQRVRFLSLGLQYTCLQREALARNRQFGRTGQELDKLIAAVRAREAFYAQLDTPWAINVPHLKWWEFSSKMSPYFGTKYYDMTRGKRLVSALPKEWKFHIDKANDGEKRNLHNEQYDDRALPSISTYQIWEKQGYEDLNGIAWYRTRFAIPKEFKDQKIYLCFGAVDESYWIYVNGQKVGENIFDRETNPNSWVDPYTADISSVARPGEENLVSVKVRDIGGAGGIYQPVILLTEAN